MTDDEPLRAKPGIAVVILRTNGTIEIEGSGTTKAEIGRLLALGLDTLDKAPEGATYKLRKKGS